MAKRRPLAAARDPLDLRLDDALDQPGQIVVEPGFQHRPQHFLDQVFQRPRIVAEHGMGQRIKGGFNGRYRRMRENWRRWCGAWALERRGLPEYGLALDRARRG